MAVLLVAALWLALAGKTPVYDKEICPYKLTRAAVKADREISTDDLAKLLMMKDPSIQLIDVRSPEEYNKFSLPGAINIPLEKLLDKDYTDVVNQDVMTNVFYSDGSEKAALAWLVCRRVGYKNNKFLDGGLNRWVETILRPKAPAETDKEAAFKQYRFRKGASIFFGGGSGAVASDNAGAAKPAAPIKRKKKEAAGGGCD